LLEVCRQNEIQVILPGQSADIRILSEQAMLFNEAGVQLAVANSECLDILDDKSKIGLFLKTRGFDVPREYQPNSLEGLPYPLFIKTRFDIGIKKIAKVNNPEELKQLLRVTEKPIIQEYLDGEEYTVDILADLSGKVIMTSPRRRLEVREGISTKGITVKNELLSKLAAACVEAFPLPGVSNVQIIVDQSQNRLCVVDVNPRFAAGGLPLAIAAGFNIPDLLIKLLLGQPLKIVEPEAGLVMMRYWHSVCVRSDQLVN